ncbi:MAG: FKBP-type peptidyl-prolyl cis-trans isomerase [Promethearchaeota archaeon]
MKVERGMKVRLEYVGILDDGTEFDKSRKDEKALVVVVEEKKLIHGFFEAILGMEIGQEKEFDLYPKDAYGDYHDELREKVPKSQFPEDHMPEVGEIFMGETENGQRIPCKIHEVGEDYVIVDMNHPLAGKTLHFKIKLLDIIEDE